MQRRNRAKVEFPSADALEEQANAYAREAQRVPDGEARRKALHKAAELRAYALMKRVLAVQTTDEKSKNAARGS